MFLVILHSTTRTKSIENIGNNAALRNFEGSLCLLKKYVCKMCVCVPKKQLIILNVQKLLKHDAASQGIFSPKKTLPKPKPHGDATPATSGRATRPFGDPGRESRVGW